MLMMGIYTGANNKYHFARPTSAQHAADILGTTPEELTRVIFNHGPPSQSLSPSYRSSALLPRRYCVILGIWCLLSRVSILLLTRDIDIVILSVRLSVTCWYCMKTA